jgi:hypothetical protein
MLLKFFSYLHQELLGDAEKSYHYDNSLWQHQKIRIGEPVLIDLYQSYIDTDPEKQLQADDPLDY